MYACIAFKNIVEKGFFTHIKINGAVLPQRHQKKIGMVHWSLNAYWTTVVVMVTFHSDCLTLQYLWVHWLQFQGSNCYMVVLLSLHLYSNAFLAQPFLSCFPQGILDSTPMQYKSGPYYILSITKAYTYLFLSDEERIAQLIWYYKSESKNCFKNFIFYIT